MCCDLLTPFEWRIASPRPRRCVMRSHARATPLVQAAVRFDCFQLLIARKRDAVEGSHFIERPVLRSFHARAVVTEDVNNEGVVGEAHVLDRLHDAADSVVDVFLETGVNFHLTRIHFLHVRWYAVPSWEHRITGRKLGVGGNHTELLLSCECVLAQLVPALIELAFVFVAPFLRHLVRGMACTRWPEEFARWTQR